MRNEQLENRQLLAADLAGLRHNHFDPEDVNDDGAVAPNDALMIVNLLNRRGGEAAEDEPLVFSDVDNDGHRSPRDVLQVINRLNRRSADRQGDPSESQRPGRDTPIPEAPIPEFPLDSELREIDGSNNNLENPNFGTAGQPLLRISDADYADGIAEPAGEDRPSAREISNALSDTGGEDTRSERGLSAFIYVWGQFIDHDIGLTIDQEGDEAEVLGIAVPQGDTSFDPFGTGTAELELVRSQFDSSTGTSIENPRQQVSEITSYVDGSMVYGSDQETADSLRSFSGGELLITDDGLLPTDADGDVMAGDIRAAENISLTSLHALFVREHNRLAGEIAAEDPSLDDEAIYQQARALVIAEIQAITYNEFLPALLGQRAISRYDGYDSSVDPNIANEFSTAAFRFGHSTLNDDVEFFDNDGRESREGLSLLEAFQNPSLLEETGIDSLLKYVGSSQAQEVDLEVVDSLRNAVFGPPGSGGFDLVALNIQRGRDHGLADYNSIRVAYGLEPVESFSDITSDVEIQEKLEGLYGSVDNIDAWVGMLAEDHQRGSSVGETAGTIIAEQFERLRDGDRFWYENTFSGSDLRQLRQTTLADVIENNTNVTGLQENVFFMRAELSGRVLTTPDSAGEGERGQAGNQRGGERLPGLGGSSLAAASGITVQLLNGDGELVETTTTDSQGRYRFRSIAETGDYTVQVVTESPDGDVGTSEDGDAANLSLDVLVSNGLTRIRNLNFTI
ncbi:MAG: peroxidase family protein [Aureliella sp.]